MYLLLHILLLIKSLQKMNNTYLTQPFREAIRTANCEPDTLPLKSYAKQHNLDPELLTEFSNLVSCCSTNSPSISTPYSPQNPKHPTYPKGIATPTNFCNLPNWQPHPSKYPDVSNIPGYHEFADRSPTDPSCPNLTPNTHSRTTQRGDGSNQFTLTDEQKSHFESILNHFKLTPLPNLDQPEDPNFHLLSPAARFKYYYHTHQYNYPYGNADFHSNTPYPTAYHNEIRVQPPTNTHELTHLVPTQSSLTPYYTRVAPTPSPLHSIYPLTFASVNPLVNYLPYSNSLTPLHSSHVSSHYSPNPQPYSVVYA